MACGPPAVLEFETNKIDLGTVGVCIIIHRDSTV